MARIHELTSVSDCEGRRCPSGLSGGRASFRTRPPASALRRVSDVPAAQSSVQRRSGPESKAPIPERGLWCLGLEVAVSRGASEQRRVRPGPRVSHDLRAEAARSLGRGFREPVDPGPRRPRYTGAEIEVESFCVRQRDNDCMATKSKAPQKPAKPARRSTTPRQAPPKPPRRAMPAEKKEGRRRRRDPLTAQDPVAASEHETMIQNGWGSGEQNPMIKKRMSQTALLRSLIEPRTPALIQVMEDIAMNRVFSATEKDEKGNPKPVDVHPSIRMECADRLLSRAYGKPKEHMVIDEPDAVEDQDEVRALLNNILKSVGAPLLDGGQEAADA